MMLREEIIAKAESFESWYHRIELTPGYFTKSRMEGSFHIWEMIRRVRRGLDYTGKRVLDIGTMDGMWAFEAEDLGAVQVIASDIWQADKDGQERVNFAALCRDSRIVVSYVNAENLNRYDHIDPFEIIQCLGMLYHVQNPLLVLRGIRNTISKHGYMLLETACYRSGNEDIPMVRLNTDEGVYCDPTTFWVPNRRALLDMLTLHRFKPVEGSIQTSEEPRSYRICMICQPI